jgi:pantoate--beta-alanine ligase
MRTITSLGDMSEAVRLARASGRTVGLVPTMGFLHEGHLSLVRASRSRTDVTVVSIFVNPLQFGPREDFRDYPRDLARDSAMLEAEGVDILFCPEAGEMYPPGFQTFVEVRDLQDKLCGRSRPGHFRGVCTVVLKLFEIVRPEAAFFGQKDAQQAVIIKRFVRDLDLDVAVEVCPIVREPDGLALSSRNTYLGPDERRAATVLWRGLEEARKAYGAGERRSDVLGKLVADLVAAEPLARPDYIAVVDPETLDPLDRVDGRALVALAVFIGRTRLIDNILLGTAA